MSSGAVPGLIVTLRRFLDGPFGPPRGSHGVLAVSGGADSTALAAGMARLAPRRGLRLTVGHVDHGLRSTSAEEARRVCDLAAALDLDVQVVVAPVESHRAVETTARRRRYRALRRIADDVGAVWIATAHTRDDQVETMLLRLLRGAGRGALGGMRPARGRLVRPMLEATRADVRWYLGTLGMTPIEDLSNADLRFTRNRVRHLVLPLLEREVADGVGARLADLGRRLRDEDEYLETCATERATALGVHDCLPAAVSDEPPAIARRIVRRWLIERGGSIGSRHVEAVLGIAARPGGRTVSVPGPGYVTRIGDALVWEAGARPASRAPFRYPAAPGSEIVGPAWAPWRLVFSTARPARDALGGDARASQTLFDADRLRGSLEVRSVRPGDRINIPGVGTRKLQDLLVDRHVPRARRAGVPVVTVDDEIAWIPLLGRSAVADVGPATVRIVRAELHHDEVFGLPVENRCGTLDATRVSPARRR